MGLLHRNGLVRGDEFLPYEVGHRHRREHFTGQREALRHLDGSGGILGTWTAGLESDDEGRSHNCGKQTLLVMLNI
jgi:hypothetical protein